MGLRFQRRIKILPGLSINLSKSGIGFSVGARGFHAGIDAKGRRYTSASLPGTGLSWRGYRKTGLRRLNPPVSGGQPQLQSARSGAAGWVAIAIVILFISLYRLCCWRSWGASTKAPALGSSTVQARHGFARRGQVRTRVLRGTGVSGHCPLTRPKC
jgi:hypothetical protein